MKPPYIGAILVLLALVVPASPAHAGGIVSICDETHVLAALAGGGTVTFACSGTITLTDTISVEANTTLDGSGQTVTISGNNAVRAVNVNSGVTLNLNNLTVANSADSGIHNYGGIVTVSNSTFSDNRASDAGGGIYNENGTLIVSNSTFVRNRADGGGGGIFNNGDGRLTVSNSSFSSNSASSGGGIANDTASTLTVSNCTFSGNIASSSGGGIYNDAGSTFNVNTSTFSGNRAGANGGGIHNESDSTVTVSNSTFSGNNANIGGGGIFHVTSGTVMLKNTIVASSPMGGNCSGAIADGSGNLTYPGATCPGLNADPRLGILQDNGGPTHTMALGAGSAALDAANDAICAAPPVNNRDQRGVTRPQGAHCDIGAYEAALGPTTRVAFLPLIMR